MNKKISAAGVSLVKYFESLFLTAYWDSTGHVWTIGYGHTGNDVYQGLTITEYAAEQLLRTDLEESENIVNTNVLVELNQGQFDAIVSFTFNGGFGMLEGSMLDNLNASNFAWCSEHFTDYVYSGGVYLEGLYNRRVKERELFDTGIFNGIPAEGGENPPPSSNIKLKNYYLFNKENRLFGQKFYPKDYNFKLIKVEGRKAYIKDGEITHIINKNNLI